MSRALIIFVRNPELGKVKTRLAAQIGAEKALQVYEKLLEHTRVVASGTPCAKYVFVTEPLTISRWETFHQENQINATLGERMLHAFELLFARGYNQVVIIGSDCPGLTSSHINAAFESLERDDVAIGPAKDGGYYLLGLKKLYAPIFRDKKWSTSSVFEDTMASIKVLRLSCHVLGMLTDVDEEEDLPQSWRNGLSFSPDFT